MTGRNVTDWEREKNTPPFGFDSEALLFIFHNFSLFFLSN